MSDPLLWHRLQFAFTLVFHYLFPQLTMGLALLIVVMKAIGLRTGDRRWDDAARFWIRIFGINFAVGVVTGIPMEFQFGTNWARFSRYAGGVIGQTLAMEGLFAFFLESSFLGLLVFGERRPRPARALPGRARAFVGSWLSVLHHLHQCLHAAPVGHVLGPGGTLELHDFWTFLLNPLALAQYAHNMVASGCGHGVLRSDGGRRLLRPPDLHPDHAPRFLRIGVIAGLVSSVLVAFPTGDQQAKLVARHQPVALAAMEGHFESETGAGIVVIGQPNVKERRLDNAITIPGFLSFLAFGTFHSNVKGLNDFPEDLWPDNIDLLYYSFHIMAGLGTLLILVMAIALLEARGTPGAVAPDAGTLMLHSPSPTSPTTGWMTAELGRQPWIVLWPHAHRGRRREPAGALGNGAVHADRLHGPVLRAGTPVPVPDRAGARPRARSARGPRAAAGRASRGGGRPWLRSGSPSCRSC